MSKKSIKGSVAYLSKAELKRGRGWSESLIAKFLGEPDRRVQNPHYPSQAAMYQFAKNRVLNAEKRADFKRAQKHGEIRSEAGKKAAKISANVNVHSYVTEHPEVYNVLLAYLSPREQLARRQSGRPTLYSDLVRELTDDGWRHMIEELKPLSRKFAKVTRWFGNLPKSVLLGRNDRVLRLHETLPRANMFVGMDKRTERLWNGIPGARAMPFHRQLRIVRDRVYVETKSRIRTEGAQ